jgi:flagellar biogenesis protein FliO
MICPLLLPLLLLLLLLCLCWLMKRLMRSGQSRSSMHQGIV